MFDLVERAIQKSKADFIEVNAIRSWSTRVSTRNDEIEATDSGLLVEAGVRVLIKGSWGMAATNSLESLGDAVSRAEKMARASSRSGIDAHLADVPATVKDIKMKVKKNPADYGLEEKAKRCLELSKLGLEGEKIHATNVSFMDSISEAYYANSEGSRLSHDSIVSFFAFSAFAKGGTLQRDSSEIARHAGFELLDGAEKIVKKTCDDVRLLLRAELPPKGKQTVIVDPKMAGTLAHEAIGHALEADTVINGNSTITRLGQRVGSSLISITDDPTIPGLFGSFPFDSEGTMGAKTRLIENGRVKSFLHSRETAYKMKQKPTGNARSSGPMEFPLVRMSNTFIEPGDSSFEEMLEGIQEGVFVRGFKGGVSDTDTGVFQFAAPHGNIIKNGKLTEPLRDITLLGNITDTLKKIDAVGRTLGLGFPGFCGKAGQMVPVSSGGPYMRIREVLVA
ncbi:MAG: TldD/PmbA family protein [Candidatus Diapherotrites archaeon]|nr:TldD/PmbA family protein [Candidatus Diapherotrites archaeon]